ncbi:hypothetical protein TNCV_4579951 [Trichonephila clavipes]|nr:hypothetical protein TNCV_4579951 [Trichonephila clavipes]
MQRIFSDFNNFVTFDDSLPIRATEVKEIDDSSDPTISHLDAESDNEAVIMIVTFANALHCLVAEKIPHAAGQRSDGSTGLIVSPPLPRCNTASDERRIVRMVVMDCAATSRTIAQQIRDLLCIIRCPLVPFDAVGSKILLLALVAIAAASLDVIPHYSHHGHGHGISSRYFRKAQGHGYGLGYDGYGYGGLGYGYGYGGLGYGGYGLGYGYGGYF